MMLTKSIHCVVLGVIAEYVQWKCWDGARSQGMLGVTIFLRDQKRLFFQLYNRTRMRKAGSKFPSEWKKANVTPIYKKNDRQNDNNYRPISLLSSIGKLLERIVFIRVYEYCMRHNLLMWRNLGYKHLDSTLNQLNNKWKTT